MKILPGDKTKSQKLDSMIRVNQAGEYGAKRIYLGQLSILSQNKEIKDMLEQELKHLEYFNNQVKARKVRPTVLQPIWHVGGFMLGAITALMGVKAAMACTVAVEEVIGEHYNEQLDQLQSMGNELELTEHVKKFRDEELEHKNIGLEFGAEKATGYILLKNVVKIITKTAITLSKRL